MADNEEGKIDRIFSRTELEEELRWFVGTHLQKIEDSIEGVGKIRVELEVSKNITGAGKKLEELAKSLNVLTRAKEKYTQATYTMITAEKYELEQRQKLAQQPAPPPPAAPRRPEATPQESNQIVKQEKEVVETKKEVIQTEVTGEDAVQSYTKTLKAYGDSINETAADIERLKKKLSEHKGGVKILSDADVKAAEQQLEKLEAELRDITRARDKLRQQILGGAGATPKQTAKSSDKPAGTSASPRARKVKEEADAYTLFSEEVKKAERAWQNSALSMGAEAEETLVLKKRYDELYLAKKRLNEKPKVPKDAGGGSGGTHSALPMDTTPLGPDEDSITATIAKIRQVRDEMHSLKGSDLNSQSGLELAEKRIALEEQLQRLLARRDNITADAAGSQDPRRVEQYAKSLKDLERGKRAADRTAKEYLLNLGAENEMTQRAVAVSLRYREEISALNKALQSQVKAGKAPQDEAAWNDLTKAIAKARNEYTAARNTFGKDDDRTKEKLAGLQQLLNKRRELNREIKGGGDVPAGPSGEAKQKTPRQEENYYKQLQKDVEAAWAKVAKLVHEQGLLAPATREAFVEYRKLYDELSKLKQIKGMKVDILGPKDAFTQIADDIFDATRKADDLAQQLAEARAEQQKITDAGGKLSVAYTLATKKVEDLEDAYGRARVALRAQSDEFQRLLDLRSDYESMNKAERKSDKGRALDAEIRVKSAQLSGQTVTVDANTEQAVASIEALRAHLRALQEEQANTKDNRAWNRLQADIEAVEGQIDGATLSLGKYLTEQDKVAKNGLFGNLKAEARDAKKAWEDLLLKRQRDPGQVDQSAVDDAFRKWKALEDQIQRVALAQKTALGTSPQQKETARLQEIQRLNALLDQQKRKSKDAKDMMAAIVAQSGQVGRNSQEFLRWAKAADTADARTKLLEADLRKLSEASREQQAIDAQDGKAAAEFDRQHSALEKLNSIYQALLQSMEELGNEGRELAAKQTLGIADSADLKRLHEIEEQLDSLTGTLSKYERILQHGSRRNKEYTQSFFSLTQVIREVTNAAISIPTLFMALSNNIPMMVDDINELKEANKRAAAAGAETVPVWKRMMSVIFSWNTAIVLAMTVLMMFADDIGAWIMRVIKWESSLDRLKKKFDEMNYALERSRRGMQEWFDFLDKNREVPDLKINISDENIPQIGKLQNALQKVKKELDDIERTDPINPGKMQVAQGRFQEANRINGKVSGMFFDNNRFPEEERNQILNGVQLENIKTLTDKQKEIAKQWIETNKAMADASKDLSDLEFTRLAKAEEVELSRTRVAKEASRILREEARITETTRAEMAQNASRAILQDERSTLEQRIASLKTIQRETVAAARADMTAVLKDPEANADAKLQAQKQFEIAQQQARLDREREEYATRYDYMVRFETSKVEILKQAAEFEAGLQDSISANYRLELEDRHRAAERAFALRKQMAEEEYRLQLKHAGLSDTQIRLFNADEDYRPRHIRATYEEILAMRATFNAKMNALAVEHADRQISIMTDELDKQTELHQEYLDQLERIYKVFDLEAGRSYSREFTDLAAQLQRGEIIYSQYLLKKDAMDTAYRQRQRQRQMEQIDEELNSKVMVNVDTDLMNVRKNIELLEKTASATIDPAQKKDLGDRLGLEKKREANLQKLQDRKLELQAKYGELTDAEADEIVAKEEKYAQKVEEAWMETYRALGEMVKAFVDAGFARREEALNHELEMLQKRSDKEREAIEQSVLNEQEKERKLGELRVREASQVEQIERKKRKLAREKAVADKAAGIFNATINTAVAVTKAVAEFGWKGALIPLIIAMGAAQVAAIAATPIPKYARGTGDHPGGLAVLGDAFRPELVLEPGRDPWVSKGTPALYDLAPHTVVLPDAERAMKDQMELARLTQDRALSLSGNPPVVEVDMGGVESGIRDVVKGLVQVKQAIKNKPNPGRGGLSDREILMLLGPNL